MIQRTEDRTNRIEQVLSKRQPNLIAIFENIHDPHNLSACLRSCDAVGIMNIYVVYHSGQEPPPIGNKSSSGARKWFDYHYMTNIEECFKLVKADGFSIFTTHLSSDSVSLYDIDFTEKIALVFGNEHSGVSEEALKLADGNFNIPQVGMIQSLNISVACAVSVYEAYRQKNNAGQYDNISFEKAKYDEYLNNWLKK